MEILRNPWGPPAGSGNNGAGLCLCESAWSRNFIRKLQIFPNQHDDKARINYNNHSIFQTSQIPAPGVGVV